MPLTSLDAGPFSIHRSTDPIHVSRASRRTAEARRAVAARPSRRRWVVWGAAAVVLVAVLAWLLRPPPVPPRPAFSGDAALADVYRQVAFGPRVPGTPAHRATRAWIVSTLDSLGLRVSEQAFRFVSPRDSSVRLDGVNILAQFRPEAPRRLMLAAHWDTRAVADQDPDPAKRTQPVPGANDGASGVAVLVEMARLLARHPIPQPVGIDLLFFDLEDAGEHFTPEQAARLAEGSTSDPRGVPFAIGSQAFVAANPAYRPQFGILLDMVGDTNLRIPREGYSARYAPEIVAEVWKAARRAGATAFVDAEGPAVEDDHVAFLQAGIPVVDLIHAPFPPTWHTTADTPANVSAASLQQVGNTLVELLWTPADAATNR